MQFHEYAWGGTAKLLVLSRPSAGLVCAEPVERARNEVLHPWLESGLEQILSELALLPGAGSPCPFPAGHW